MIKCDCYCTEEKIIGWHTLVNPKIKIVHKCNGTRERDECSCGGDRAKCDFYPEVREKALKEIKPKFGEWISVKDRLPTWEDGKVLIYTSYGISIAERTTSNRWKGDCAIPKLITHWMPLPEPPKGVVNDK